MLLVLLAGKNYSKKQKTEYENIVTYNDNNFKLIVNSSECESNVVIIDKRFDTDVIFTEFRNSIIINRHEKHYVTLYKLCSAS